MAFEEIQFPPNISYGASGGPQFLTTIVELADGHEKRNVEWAIGRAVYDVSHGVKTQAQLDTLIAFFRARQGRAHGFRFKDWSDYNVPETTIGQTDGSTTDFQIFKDYTSGSQTYRRNITKPVAGSLTVEVNDVVITQGAGANQYQVDLTTGIITLGSTHAATSGQNVDVVCEFDVPVRFDTDLMNPNFQTYNIYSWNQIPLVEVKA